MGDTQRAFLKASPPGAGGRRHHGLPVLHLLLARLRHVLSDLGSSAFDVGGIAEQAIGKAAPWFTLGVMPFSYAVRAVYIESLGCSSGAACIAW